MNTIAEIKPSQLRRYLYEYVLIGLVLSVGYLFVRTEKLNTYIRNDLTDQKIETRAAILKNDQTMREFLDNFKTDRKQ